MIHADADVQVPPSALVDVGDYEAPQNVLTAERRERPEGRVPLDAEHHRAHDVYAQLRGRLALWAPGLRAGEVGIHDRVDCGVKATRVQVDNRPDLAAPHVRLELGRHVRQLEVHGKAAPQACGPR